MTQDRPKDPMIKARSTIRGKNSKGGDRFQIYLTSEEAQTLAETLTANLENPKGVKIDMHISKKTAGDTGREFDSTIMFVKAVSDAPYGSGGGPKNFVPKGGPDTAERIKAIKNAQVKG